jgi:hypothetical protein
MKARAYFRPKEVRNEFERFETEVLIKPVIEDISRLPDEYFQIWIVRAPTVCLSDWAKDESSEDLILDIAISCSTAGGQSNLKIFRRSELEFRMVTATTFTNEENREAMHQRIFPLNMTETRLIAAYAESNQPATMSTNKFLLYPTQDHRPLWQDFKSKDDIFLFQQALIGYRVHHEMTNVKWSFNGSDKPGKYGIGMLQLWQPKPLPKVQTGETDNASGRSVPIERPQSSSIGPGWLGSSPPISGTGPLTPLNTSAGDSGTTRSSQSSIIHQFTRSRDNVNLSPPRESRRELAGTERRSSTSGTSIADSTKTFLTSSSLTSGVSGSHVVLRPPDHPVLIMYTLWEKRKTIEHLKRRRH